MNITPSSDLIQQWVDQEVPEKLWHYTSTQGFQGIISSGKIWATDVRFLNDIEEFVHAKKIALKFIDSLPKFGEDNFPIQDDLRRAAEYIWGSDLLNPDKARIFTASFTDSADDLSQWRGYSQGSSGISVSFDLRFLRKTIPNDSAVIFAPCIYEDEDKARLIQWSLQQIADRQQARWTEGIRERMQEIRSQDVLPTPDENLRFAQAWMGEETHAKQMSFLFDDTFRRIFRLSGLLKHKAFRQEREWRMVLPLRNDPSTLRERIKHRSPGTVIIPYIEQPLSVPQIVESTQEVKFTLPIRDVLLGPGSTKTELDGARAFLRSLSIDVEPRMSEIPYRQV